VRRGVYLLLAVFLVQLTGLRALCVPIRAQSHSCCPASTSSMPATSTTLPDCCLTSLLNYQGSITEGQSSISRPELTAQSVIEATPRVAPVAAQRAPSRRSLLGHYSPPVTPLAQTCLLLI